MPYFPKKGQLAMNDKIYKLSDLKVGDRFEIAGTGHKGKILNIGVGSVLVSYDAHTRTNEFGETESVRSSTQNIARQTEVRCLNHVA